MARKAKPKEAEGLPDGMRFDGDMMGFWAFNSKKDKCYTRLEEFQALDTIHHAVEALKKLGWRDVIYCPKDGTQFLVVEAGCTAVWPCRYHGEWPKGSWFVQHSGDEWPAHPILFHPMRTPEPEEGNDP
jgi:hypothetical protein